MHAKVCVSDCSACQEEMNYGPACNGTECFPPNSLTLTDNCIAFTWYEAFLDDLVHQLQAGPDYQIQPQVVIPIALVFLRV